MHKRIAHPVPVEQSDSQAPPINVTPEQLEDLRNFVASLVNSLASHAGTLFNKISTDVNELREKVNLINKYECSRQQSHPPPASNQPPSLDSQSSSVDLQTQELSRRCSIELEKSIEQMLEEFPSYKETSPVQKSHQTPEMHEWFR